MSLFDQPQLIPPQESDLEIPSKNRELAGELLRSKTITTVKKTAYYDIIHTGNKNYGTYAVVRDGGVVYLMNYSARNLDPVGIVVTQNVLYRSVYDRATITVPHDVFFDFLLMDYAGVMTDGEKTPYGQRFWKMAMADADRLGYTVGLIHLDKKVVTPFDRPTIYNVRFANNDDAWGYKSKRPERFFITRHKLPMG